MTVWNIPLTIVSQTKSAWGLTKQAMSPKFSSIPIFLIFVRFVFIIIRKFKNEFIF